MALFSLQIYFEPPTINQYLDFTIRPLEKNIISEFPCCVCAPCPSAWGPDFWGLGVKTNKWKTKLVKIDKAGKDWKFAKVSHFCQSERYWDCLPSRIEFRYVSIIQWKFNQQKVEFNQQEKPLGSRPVDLQSTSLIKVCLFSFEPSQNGLRSHSAMHILRNMGTPPIVAVGWVNTHGTAGMNIIPTDEAWVWKPG